MKKRDYERIYGINYEVLEESDFDDYYDFMDKYNLDLFEEEFCEIKENFRRFKSLRKLTEDELEVLREEKRLLIYYSNLNRLKNKSNDLELYEVQLKGDKFKYDEHIIRLRKVLHLFPTMDILEYISDRLDEISEIEKDHYCVVDKKSKYKATISHEGKNNEDLITDNMLSKSVIIDDSYGYSVINKIFKKIKELLDKFEENMNEVTYNNCLNYLDSILEQIDKGLIPSEENSLKDLKECIETIKKTSLTSAKRLTSRRIETTTHLLPDLRNEFNKVYFKKYVYPILSYCKLLNENNLYEECNGNFRHYKLSLNGNDIHVYYNGLSFYICDSEEVIPEVTSTHPYIEMNGSHSCTYSDPGMPSSKFYPKNSNYVYSTDFTYDYMNTLWLEDIYNSIDNNKNKKVK